VTNILHFAFSEKEKRGHCGAFFSVPAEWEKIEEELSPIIVR
jgi:hypothetical protein